MSVPPLQYLPVHRKKENAIQESLVKACSHLVPTCTMESRVWRVDIGRGHTWEGRGSYLLYAKIFCLVQKSMDFTVLIWRYMDPTDANICPME